MFTQIMDEDDSGKIGWKGVGRRCEHGIACLPNILQETTETALLTNNWYGLPCKLKDISICIPYRSEWRKVNSEELQKL